MSPVASSIIIHPGQAPGQAPPGKVRLFWDDVGGGLKAIDDSGVILPVVVSGGNGPAGTVDLAGFATNAPPDAPPEQYVRLYFDDSDGLVKYRTASGSLVRIDRSEWIRPRLLQVGPQANYNLNPSGVIMPAWNPLSAWENGFPGVPQLYYIDPADNTKLRVQGAGVVSSVSGSLSINNDSSSRLNCRSSLWVNGTEIVGTRSYIHFEKNNQGALGSIVFPGFPVSMSAGDFLQVKVFGATATTFNSNTSTILVAAESSLAISIISGVNF
ncbi:MAG: hypothetical protein KKD63_16860 [Proteobacteria bacterium]|nr:hypothetical protein [Desulfobulbaceae bacterium]MBU4154543.1 hypothetical protein [Pseudomonadota bacterium]